MSAIISANQSAAKLDLCQSSLTKAFDLCVQKTRINIKDLADNPKSWSNAVDGDYSKWNEGFYELGNWTTSFFTGMALLAWRETEDEYFLQQTLRLAPAYREKALNPQCHSHHDMGFLYSLYSIAIYKLTGDKEHREVGIAAAEGIAARCNPNGNFIRAWGQAGTTEHDNMAIVDCLMNLPLLFWAANETGDTKFREIAVRHANMCLKYFIRPDDSVIHALRFDLKTGQPIGPDNFCGHSNESYWARGATWAIYGFALAHRYTGGQKYLEASVRLAKKFITELDGEVVPVWDFRLPKNATPVRDASAAAVMVCAIQELEKLQVADPELLKAKVALLSRICSDDYLDVNPGCRGVLKSGYGSKVAFSSWGDYYLMEAVTRELNRSEPFW